MKFSSTQQARRGARRSYMNLVSGRGPAIRRMLEPLEDRTMLTVMSGFSDQLIASGISSPLGMEFAPDGRIFVGTQAGQLDVIKNGVLLPTPFVSLSTDSSGERGMSGIAFDPNFATNHYVYIYYCATAPTAHYRLSRFTANGDVSTGVETVLIDFPDTRGPWHMGGAMHFGPDGMLYISIGDQLARNTVQDLTQENGKMLRLNVDNPSFLSVPPAKNDPRIAPTDNPFYKAGGNFITNTVYALGLRNPFSFAVEPGANGRIFINDVGEGVYEHIFQLQKGANYGWPLFVDQNPSALSTPGYVDAIYEYSHSAVGDSITGGTFYEPTTPQFPASYVGQYFFGDWATGQIYALNLNTMTPTTFAKGYAPLDLKVGSDGAIYFLDRGGGGQGQGSVHKIYYSTSPAISVNPTPQIAALGGDATFTVTAAGAPPLSYQWMKNDVDIPGETNPSLTVHNVQLSDSGTNYSVRIISPLGQASSLEAKLTVSPNQLPTANINVLLDPAKSPDGLYVAGETIGYSGTAFDSNGVALPASAYHWIVTLQHEQHAHPFVDTSGAATGTFNLPAESELDPVVWYRVKLIVTDSTGLSTTIFKDIFPHEATLTLDTNIPGLLISLDFAEDTGPITDTSSSGLLREISAPVTQVYAGVTYNFASWSQGGSADQTIPFPYVNTTYIANYVVAPVPITGDGLLGTYFANTTLSGTPSGSRVDTIVNLNQQGTSPGLGVNAGAYSIRWTGQIQAKYSETYTFYMTSDDGSRVWVNGVLLVDQWYNHGPQTQRGSITLVAGQKYDIKVEYYQSGGGAQATLEWSSASQARQVVPQNALFSGGGVTTNPIPPVAPLAPSGLTVTATQQTEIDLSWTNNASDATGFVVETSADGSTNWTTAKTTAAGVTTAQITGLTAGTKYYYRVRATRSSDASQSDPSTVVNSTTLTQTVVTNPTNGDGLAGAYFNNITLTGTPVSRVDAGINFYLFGTAPIAGISGNQYSVRWTGQVQAQYTDRYTFYLTSDDGSRLWVNGVLLVDQWYNHDFQTQGGQINLVAGQKYDIKVEYYQNGGNSGAKLEWSSGATQRQVIPQAYLTSGSSGGTGGSGGTAQPISSPSGLTATNVLAHEVDLTWTNNAPTATGFVIETSADGSTNWTQAGTTLAGVTTFQATGLTAGTAYFYRVRAQAGSAISDPSSIFNTTTLPDVTGVGSGLQAQYFNGHTLSGTPLTTRVDNQINLSLSNGAAPVTGLNGNDFSVRWTGSLVAPTTDTYTLYVTSDDGIRVWINGVLQMDLWWDHDVITGRFNLNMVAGQKYDIKVEYYQHGGNAVTKLEWASNTVGRQLVPTSALLPPGA